MFVDVRFPPSVLDICLWVINNSPSDLVIFLMPIYELVLPMEAIMWEQIRRSNWQFHMDETYIWICEDDEEGDANRRHDFIRMSYDEETQRLHVETSLGPIHKRETHALHIFRFTNPENSYCHVIFKGSGKVRWIPFPRGFPETLENPLEAYRINRDISVVDVVAICRELSRELHVAVRPLFDYEMGDYYRGNDVAWQAHFGFKVGEKVILLNWNNCHAADHHNWSYHERNHDNPEWQQENANWIWIPMKWIDDDHPESMITFQGAPAWTQGEVDAVKAVLSRYAFVFL